MQRTTSGNQRAPQNTMAEIQAQTSAGTATMVRSPTPSMYKKSNGTNASLLKISVTEMVDEKTEQMIVTLKKDKHQLIIPKVLCFKAERL